MYLVDTSVWIDYIKGTDGEHVEFLDEVLQNPLAVGITDLIYMEILQGAKGLKEFERFQRYFSSRRFYSLHGKESYEQSASIYLRCRQKGITIRSSVDCLIAQCAVENELTLLHHDRDFKHMAAVIPHLITKHFLNV